jgi:enhancing lycopene biosynthesis protein 2
MDFSIWFTGDVMAYFRNNYSDSGNMANFVLTGGDESTAEYEIETLATAFGTRGYIPSGSAMLSKSVLPKKYTSESAETIGTEERIINKKLELLEKKLQLAAKLEELGYTKEEIRTELNKY